MLWRHNDESHTGDYDLLEASQLSSVVSLHHGLARDRILTQELLPNRIRLAPRPYPGS